MSVKFGGPNNSGWICDNKVVYVHKMVINNGELVEFQMSRGQKIKAFLGIGPDYDELRAEALGVCHSMGLIKEKQLGDQ